ncbi:MAG: [dimethylamine--corrinoid protein] Co-methyltransferase [Methanosarcinaceae archaeon]|nr:[dimethylamine--corrinoid protein] Co-methyltransferase [Methanosarcinaceae archaeon]
MATTYHQRMGDARPVEMTKEEIIYDIDEGSKLAAEMGRIPELTDDEKDHLLDIFLIPDKMVSVSQENRVILSADVGGMGLFGNYGEYGGVGIPMDYTTANLVMERGFAADYHLVSNLNLMNKDLKPAATQLQQSLEDTLMRTISPVEPLIVPNLGNYYKPEGPYDNAGDLISNGEIEKGLAAYEDAMVAVEKDLLWSAQAVLDPIGTDGLNLDTTAAAGDGDFLATLKATEQIKKTTRLSAYIGMANEFVLGIHGGLEYNGERLAGQYPHEQVKSVAKAGADMFGCVVNIKTKKSTPWNLAKTVTLLKRCVEDADIPVHVNMGMGVGGIPMVEIPPIDAVTRCVKATVEMTGVDGI